MKYLSFVLLFLGTISLYSCEKGCDEKPKACNDQPPEGVTCQAYFQSWVYNEGTNSCEFIGYSGCDMVGFETEAECEACECNE